MVTGAETAIHHKESHQVVGRGPIRLTFLSNIRLSWAVPITLHRQLCRTTIISLQKACFLPRSLFFLRKYTCFFMIRYFLADYPQSREGSADPGAEGEGTGREGSDLTNSEA